VGRVQRETNMKQITKTILLALVGVLGTSAASAEQVERVLDASSDGVVFISNISGSIDVKGWSKNQVKVVADLGRDVEELIVERDGDEILIKVKVPKRNARHITSVLKINIPEKSSLEISSVSADVDVEAVLGELSLQSVSGDMKIDVFGSDVEIETVSGDIHLQGDNQEMLTETSSVSGDIEAYNLSGEVEVESVSGDLELIGGSFQRVRAGTVNGDVEIKAALSSDGRLEVETINGDVEVIFQGSVSARYDIETFNGDIDNCFGPKPERTSKYTPGRELGFTEGNGDARVQIETLNGGIILCSE
jgi:DUF4097 and DUF4098 domain-containing protein YvlB